MYMGGLDVPAATRLVLWAAALPTIQTAVPASLADDLRSHLISLQAAMVEIAAGSSPGLIAGGELGLRLATASRSKDEARTLRRAARTAIADFADAAIAQPRTYLADPAAIRAIVASLIRCQRGERRGGKSLPPAALDVAAEIGLWVASMTLPGGGAALAHGKPAEPIDRPGGMLDQFDRGFGDRAAATRLATQSLRCGRDGGLIVTAVLGPSLRHCEDAGVSVLMPAWHARRGRAVLHVRGQSMRLTVLGGRRTLIDGRWDIDVAIDAVPQEPVGDWRCVCDYFDDEVQYLEWEIDLPIGWRLRRQWLSIGDDAAVMIGETVLRQPGAKPRPEAVIDLDSRLPLAGGHRCERAAAGKWQLTRAKTRGWMMSPASIPARERDDAAPPDDGSLPLRARGRGALWHPVWIDLSKKSARRLGVNERLIRPLTVALERQIVAPIDASAYRVAIGANQYLIYQSLSSSPPRTVLGKHLKAGFYVARFHPGDGGLEDLLVVDEEPDDQNDG